jgi:hypothetical protein
MGGDAGTQWRMYSSLLLLQQPFQEAIKEIEKLEVPVNGLRRDLEKL